MALVPDLSRRNLQGEVMDQPDLDPVSHREALAALARINLWSRSAEILWPVIRALADRKPGTRLGVLDVASGAGDVAIRLVQKARRSGITLDILGLDFSPLAVEYARGRAQARGVPARFEVQDVLHQPLAQGYDIVMSSLFLHHLTETDAAKLLRSMAVAAGSLMLVNDLRRTRTGYLVAQVACRLLTRSPVVRVDGPRSVAGAFSTAEIAELCNSAGLSPIRLEKRWPSRFLLTYGCGS